MSSISGLVAAIKKAADEMDSARVKTLSVSLVKAIELRRKGGPQWFCADLQSALDVFDDVRTKAICSEYISGLRSGDNHTLLASAHTFLNLLRRKRKFRLMLQVADVVLQCGECQPEVKRLYAQALIEEKRLIAAIDVLTQLELHCLESNHSHELGESRGLLGRAWKQVFIDSATSDFVDPWQISALQKAVDFYRAEFDKNPEKMLWHGINTVALCKRAKRDGIKLADPDIDDALTRIMDSITQRINAAKAGVDGDSATELDMWSQATLAEVFLARGDKTQALRWIAHYVDEQHVRANRSDAFEVSSTLRQFEEVWQLSDDDPDESKILEVLRAALLSREGGIVPIVSPASQSSAITDILNDSTYEKVLGKDRYKNLRWYQTGLNCAQCVCRIEDTFGDGYGTGFLVRSKSLGMSDVDEWIVVTNAHVVCNDSVEQQGKPAALAPEAARLRFEAGPHPECVFKITAILAWSPRTDLDFSILAVEGVQGISHEYPVAKHLPRIDSNQRTYIIGHPKGGGMSFSLHDNLLLDHEAPKLHYRSPTEGGSSGSPVFNQSWELIGLHHAGGSQMPRLNGETGHYPANEGIWIQSIISALESDR